MFDLGTDELPAEVVNQRMHLGVYQTADGDRSGQVHMAVYLDGDRSPGIPFTVSGDGWRGWDGAGLSADERRYVAATLYALATHLTALEGD